MAAGGIGKARRALCYIGRTRRPAAARGRGGTPPEAAMTFSGRRTRAALPLLAALLLACAPAAPPASAPRAEPAAAAATGSAPATPPTPHKALIMVANTS